MAIGILKTLFGSRNDRLLKQYRKVVLKVNALESTLQSLDDAALQAKTAEFKSRLTAGESLDALTPEAFAVVRESSRRVMKMRHFDAQIMGALALHQGKIAEMGTGEGKTLTATLAVYLNAIAGKGVHVVTVNDYLAQRDAEWMAKLYNFLGLQVGINLSQMGHEAKQAAYAADITYGTNNEFGFDYLRDNRARSLEDQVQRPHHFAMVDEVDSVLIDDARTPLIISGPGIDSSKEINIPVSGSDLLPTITDLAGENKVKFDHIDGGSLKKIILGEDISFVKREVDGIFFHVPYKNGIALKRPHSAIRRGDYKLIKFQDNGEILLFNIINDIKEENNLLAINKKRAKNLEKILDNYLDEVDAPKWQEGITWKNKPLKEFGSHH